MIGLLSSMRDDKPRSVKSHITTSTSSSTVRGSSSISALDDLTKDRSTAGKGRPLTIAGTLAPSTEELHLLAVSAQITEVCYTVSDIQTRIFEIQELRHQATSSTAWSSNTDSNNTSESSSADIDRALMSLDERLEAVSDMIRVIEDALEPVLAVSVTPTKLTYGDGESAEMLVLRKHHEMMDSWDEVQREADELREELREDKWLAVFRTVSSQADDMMSSLEKAVTQCHDFIWQVNRPDGADSSGSSLLSPGRLSVNMEVFNSILQAYESKKKYYVPATTKVISVIDKGMRDRATKNGECLRRHAEMRARWRNLRERMSRIDNEMEGVRTMLLEREGRDSSDEEGSMISRQTAKSKLSTSMLSNASSKAPRHQSTGSAISRSISPFRRLAARMGVGITTPSTKEKSPGLDVSPPSLRKRSSYFSVRPSAPGTPEPKRKGILSRANDGRGTPLPGWSGQASKRRWNTSTRVEYDDVPGKLPTARTTPPKERPLSPTSSAKGTWLEPMGTGRRPSISGPARLAPRAVSGPARPTSSQEPPSASSPNTPARLPRTSTPVSHSKKRSVSSSRPVTPPPPVPPLPTSLQGYRPATPSSVARPRPHSPSHIPVPAISRAGTPIHHFFGGDIGDDPDNPPTTLMQRALSPTFSTISMPDGHNNARHASSSRLPLPTFQVTSSQPSSPTTSAGVASQSPDSTALSSLRPQKPEWTVRARAQQMPFYQTPSASRSNSRPPLTNPPSSYKDSASVSGRTTPSRPSSRTASYDRTAVFSPSLEQHPVPEYIPIGPQDPLDAEVARTVNKIAHGFLIERKDPIPRTAPPKKEYKAQYTISNSFGRKAITCRLVTIARPSRGAGQESTSQKVMVRVGGGWQDLDIYLLNRQAGSL